MFKKNATVSHERVDTLIGKTSKFEGKLDADGTVRIDGEFAGNISVKGDVILGEEGKMFGDISANNVIISGTAKGNVTTSNQLKLNATGKILGDIYVSSLIVEDGAIFEGKCTMKNASLEDNVSTLNPKKAKA
ncbi:bactofilin family protein [Marinisporobacter balticus]|uniref:Cytoskeletal protein CcmA (Bactofilin family) n=1 Tax=Marinisporobacter balticus TaxID=2018667 RepID=A0A4R2KZ35_9FIRM|nr:polymer-forming cytoskeletal protein [Marinisporobacter balticus]TCO79364.1 cytoskeletal protein CcmA (bactofilin family) [Marinisporobacter balticus]